MIDRELLREEIQVYYESWLSDTDQPDQELTNSQIQAILDEIQRHPDAQRIDQAVREYYQRLGESWTSTDTITVVMDDIVWDTLTQIFEREAVE